MGTAELFDHTADVGLRLRAADLDDLFRTAAEAMFDYIVANRSEVRQVEEESIHLDADSPVDLLAAWLSELIYQCETKHRLYSRFDIRVAADGRSLDGKIGGEAIDRERHELDHEVKAVTQHGLLLERDGEDWTAEVILDI